MTTHPERIATEDLRHRLSSRLEFYRRRTKDLIDPLDDDDVHRQHNWIMSPLVWDVGHVGNFEELWLLRNLDGRQAHDLTYDEMYNPFDNPRWTRGNLPLLNRHEALEYIDEVRGDALEVLGRTELDRARKEFGSPLSLSIQTRAGLSCQRALCRCSGQTGSPPDRSNTRDRGHETRRRCPRHGVAAHQTS